MYVPFIFIVRYAKRFGGISHGSINAPDRWTVAWIERCDVKRVSRARVSRARFHFCSYFTLLCLRTVLVLYCAGPRGSAFMLHSLTRPRVAAELYICSPIGPFFMRPFLKKKKGENAEISCARAHARSHSPRKTVFFYPPPPLRARCETWTRVNSHPSYFYNLTSRRIKYFIWLIYRPNLSIDGQTISLENKLND